MLVLKMLYLLILARNNHHIAWGKTARKDVKEESDYHWRVDKSIIVYFENSNDFTWIYSKFWGFSIRKYSTTKDIYTTKTIHHHHYHHLKLTTECVKGFSPSVCSKLSVTHSKSSDSGNLEPKSELIIIWRVR